MLMDILMESLMSMDEDTLDYVLESCTDDEIEIISDAMEARVEDGPTVVDKKALRSKIINKVADDAYDFARQKSHGGADVYDLDKKLDNKYKGRELAGYLGFTRHTIDKSDISPTQKTLWKTSLARDVEDPGARPSTLNGIGTAPKLDTKNMTADEKRAYTNNLIKDRKKGLHRTIKFYDKNA